MPTHTRRKSAYTLVNPGVAVQLAAQLRSGTRATPYDTPSVFVTQSPGLRALRPADGGFLERAGRALHLCPALSAPRPRDVSGGFCRKVAFSRVWESVSH